jgi:hypothetical protein
MLDQIDVIPVEVRLKIVGEKIKMDSRLRE